MVDSIYLILPLCSGLFTGYNNNETQTYNCLWLYTYLYTINMYTYTEYNKHILQNNTIAIL